MVPQVIVINQGSVVLSQPPSSLCRDDMDLCRKFVQDKHDDRAEDVDCEEDEDEDEWNPVMQSGAGYSEHPVQEPVKAAEFEAGEVGR